MTSYDSSQPPTLLSLPGELKQEILRLVLCTSEPMRFQNGKFSCALSPNQEQERSQPLAVLSTCRDLHEHGRFVLYRWNVFEVWYPSALEHPSPPLPHDLASADRWAVAIGARNRALISKLCVHFHHPLPAHFSRLEKGWQIDERKWIANNAKSLHAVVNFLALYRTPTLPIAGLRRLEIQYSPDLDGNLVHDATFWRSLAMLTQLESLKIWAIPYIWAQYLNRVMRIPVLVESASWYWEFGLYFEELEHAMRMCKTYAANPVTVIPKDWKDSAEYRAIEVPEFPDGDMEVTGPSDEHMTYYLTWYYVSYGGVLHQPEAFPLTKFEPDRSLSSILRGVKAIMAGEDLVSGQLSAVGFHNREYELLRRKHAYMLAVWEEFKALGLVQRKDHGEANRDYWFDRFYHLRDDEFLPPPGSSLFCTDIEWE